MINDMNMTVKDNGKAKEYQAIRRKLTLVHLALTPGLLAVMLLSGFHLVLRDLTAAVAGGNEWMRVAVYFSLFSVYFLVFDLPLSFYSGFRLEHRFGLSNQTLGAWVSDFLKRSFLSFALSLALIELLYFILRAAPGTWWLWAWAGYAFVSYILGKIFPVVIVPLFYKYGKLDDETLAQKVKALAARFGMPVGNVYSLNLSKTTRKANAAFMGIGRTKRVVLSDTLISNFT
ncbi:MAG TPA: M48 family metalloprotease, partial [Candidatus Omnitrophota bacterium]|nr:M48 family metalloprotease [Candidatus Omnitrophota bacterium]